MCFWGLDIDREQTKYFDPMELKKLDYTGMTTTGEMSGTQAVDFHTLGHDFFPAGSAARLWLDAYAKGVDRFLSRATAAGVKPYCAHAARNPNDVARAFSLLAPPPPPPLCRNRQATALY